MRPFVPLESSSFRLRAGWYSMVDAGLQLIRLLLVAVFLVMLAWSTASQMRAGELPGPKAVPASVEIKVASADWRGDHDPRA